MPLFSYRWQQAFVSPFVPSDDQSVDSFVKVCPRPKNICPLCFLMFAQHLRIGPGHVVVDLGCGDGKICFAAAAAGAHAIGILSPSLPFLRPLSPALVQE